MIRKDHYFKTFFTLMIVFTDNKRFGRDFRGESRLTLTGDLSVGLFASLKFITGKRSQISAAAPFFQSKTQNKGVAGSLFGSTFRRFFTGDSCCLNHTGGN